MRRVKGMTVALLAGGALLAGCDGEEGPYLEVEGGGFVFNYRISEAHAGVVATALRELPAETRVVATFENPAGGDDIVVDRPARPGQRRFVLDTPPLRGVEKDRPYRVTLRLEPAEGGQALETHELSFRSNVSQKVLATAPLTVGPGYARNPDLAR